MGCNKCGRDSPLEWYRTEGHIFLLCDDCLEEKRRLDADEKEKEKLRKQGKEMDPVEGCLALSGCGGCLGLIFFIFSPLILLWTYTNVNKANFITRIEAFKFLFSNASRDQWRALEEKSWGDPYCIIILKASIFLILLCLLLTKLSEHLNKRKKTPQ
jgi:hypothetical protein